MPAGLAVLFVIDPLEALILETETSLLLMSEAARRGHAPWITYLRELYLDDGGARTRARPIDVDESVRPFYRLGPPEDRRIGSFDIVLMRKDPPVDVDYHNALAILSRARDEVPVLNDPIGMGRSNEKLLPLERMAQKSAQIDAVLRTGALSDAFTQDLEDVQEPEEALVRQQKHRIVALLKLLGVGAADKAGYEAVVQQYTGLALVPALYPDIIVRLEARVSERLRTRGQEREARTRLA